ncbi:ABC transporter ATP-binding protein [Parasedimentitalea huanghaiensis]|uniref:ATP-binding cassette domain-containing protein n=1 Tax=Parasedimentitalea huanghaiensis TaxID=2682100 RepID=A0A6L6WLM3_9RHOB|nr:ABC transporter ATP-binding protein [Zongyanglinia huanghaiensis]MVO16582.1 ATP-binding cassette domain-containing protein [Zongyanglinia huanghaiensis]
MQGTDPLVQIQNLDVSYYTKGVQAKALHNIGMEILPGERLGLVGESGCGKSTLLKTIMGVLPPNGKVNRGSIEMDGRNLIEMDEKLRRQTRWAEISMITQSALNALNPVQRIDRQIIEAIRTHQAMSKEQAAERVSELFGMVGVDPARARDYPHQFSGGMRQRAVIAMALALSPQLIIADEPTTALDVIVQDQIFSRLRQLQQDRGFAMILVTHDIALVVENCQKICVMYAGMIIEAGNTRDIIQKPRHPYTIGLINAVSVLGSVTAPIAIPGSPPNLFENLEGCRFAPRCPFASALCHQKIPEPTTLENGQKVLCHHWSKADEFSKLAKSPETWMQSTTATT